MAYQGEIKYEVNWGSFTIGSPLAKPYMSPLGFYVVAQYQWQSID